jgi:NAD-dependent deacetylase
LVWPAHTITKLITRAYTNIVILTGAGISRESGLETFRDKDGIWSRVSIDEVATPRAFARNPKLVHAFYNARRRALLSPAVQPNAAHHALARLEHQWAGSVLIITQNIDDLHERAGSVNVVHIHGQLLQALCTACKSVTGCVDDLSTETACPTCRMPGTMRPNVVWFGEDVMCSEIVQPALRKCSLFLAIGTSGTVYPAAAFVEDAKAAHAHTVELNLEASSIASSFDETIEGPATEVVPRFVEMLLTGNHLIPNR